MSISVCMATYNGSRFLREQLDSILDQLDPDDEVVVVDDGSTDGTLAVLDAIDDPRVTVHRNPRNLGHVRTFARALSLARHDDIFLSDQDDIWMAGRVQVMLAALRDSGAMVVAGNAAYIDRQGHPTTFECHRVRASDSRHTVANIVGIFAGRRGYFGCAMAMQRSVLAIALPIPDFVESHDLWLAKIGILSRAIAHIDDNTLARRIHGANVTDPNRPLLRKLWSRVVFFRSLLVIAGRLARSRASMN